MTDNAHNDLFIEPDEITSRVSCTLLMNTAGVQSVLHSWSWTARAGLAKSEVERLQDVLANGHITVEALEDLDQEIANMPPGSNFMLIGVKEANGQRTIETGAPIPPARRFRSKRKRNLTNA